MVQCANFLIAKAAIGFLAHKMSQWSMLIVETGANPQVFIQTSHRTHTAFATMHHTNQIPHAS